MTKDQIISFERVRDEKRKLAKAMEEISHIVKSLGVTGSNSHCGHELTLIFTKFRQGITNTTSECIHEIDDLIEKI